MKKFLSLIAAAAIACALAAGLSACGPQVNVGDTETLHGVLYTLVKNPKGGYGYTARGIDNTATEIRFPSFVKKDRPVIGIEDNAFSGYTQLKSISIPYFVTEVGENAFAGCESLETVYVGKVDSIGKNAFAKCENLKTVYVSSVEDWCNISFANMAANPMYYATEFCDDGEPVEDLVIPFMVDQVPDFAFYECENIKSVTIEGALKIGRSAFYGSAIESVDIKWGVTEMGELAFADCSSLTTVQLGEKIEVIGEYAFLRCAQLDKITVPATVKSIEASAFSDCVSLGTVNLNEGLEYIGDCAFSGCASLKELNMPTSVKNIGFGIVMFGGSSGFGSGGDTANQVGKITLSPEITEIPDYSFSYCGIKNIIIGDKVTQINYSAFYGCEQLESVVIPKSVTKVTSYAFYRCLKLDTVYYTGTEEEWKAINIGRNGNEILFADKYYYSETQPTAEGNFWHYVNGEPTKW